MEEIRTFRAGTLQEALQLVRHSLGPDAAVLTTRNLTVNRLGLFPKTMIEVEASVDRPTSPRFSDEQLESTEPSDALSTHDDAPYQFDEPEPETVPRSAVAQLATAHSPAAQTNTARTVARRRAAGASPPGSPDQPPAPPVHPSGVAIAAPATARFGGGTPAERPRQPSNQSVASNTASRTSPRESAAPGAAAIAVLTEMLENGVEPTYAKALLTATTQQMPADFASDPWKIRQQLNRIVMERLECAGGIQATPGERKVVAFVGPTGSGKTSTLAKVAAGIRFDTGCQVGLITVDTFRLGAVDQLLQYAELMSAPLEVVSSTGQISGALERMAECDLVMLDTAGRSHRDADQLHVLKELIQAAQPDSVQLVVSATCARAQVYDTIAKFSDVGATQLLITKLDEAVAFGEWMSVLCEASLPVSYLTTGQHVPQDISTANPRRLASMLLGTDSHDLARPALSVD